MKKVFYFLGALFAFSLLSGESLAQEYRMTRSFALYPLPRLTATAPTYPKAGTILTIKGDKEGEFFKVNYLEYLLYMHESSMPYCTLIDSMVDEKGRSPIEYQKENRLRKDLARAKTITRFGAGMTIFGGGVCLVTVATLQAQPSLENFVILGTFFLIGTGMAMIGLPLLISGVVQTGKYRSKMLQLNPNFSLSPLVIQGPDRHSMGVLLGVRFSL